MIEALMTDESVEKIKKFYKEEYSNKLKQEIKNVLEKYHVAIIYNEDTKENLVYYHDVLVDRWNSTINDEVDAYY